MINQPVRFGILMKLFILCIIYVILYIYMIYQLLKFIRRKNKGEVNFRLNYSKLWIDTCMNIYIFVVEMIN